MGDKGYPLLPWLRVLLKQFDNVCHIVLETLYNKHSCRGRSVVETHLACWKKFQTLLLKTNLDVLFLYDLMACCCILYNMILNEKDLDIETLMLQLNFENVGNAMHVPITYKFMNKISQQMKLIMNLNHNCKVLSF